MNTQHNIEERLWNYIDGTAAAEEKTVIGKLLETDTAWKAKYHELLEVHQLVQSSELDAPSLRFSKNVMEEIAKMHIAPATKSYINKKIIWTLGFFFIALLVGFLIYGFGQMNFSSGQGNYLVKKPEQSRSQQILQQYLGKCVYDDQCSTWIGFAG
jgi:hypothetical protein